MHFAFTEEQGLIAESARGFLSGFEGSARSHLGSDDGVDWKLWRALSAEMGFAGLSLPEPEGGSGLGMVEAAIVAEAAGEILAPIPFISSVILAGAALAAGADHWARAGWLRSIAQGELVASYVVATGRVGGDRLTLEGLAPHGAASSLFVVEVDGQAWAIDGASPGVTVEPLRSMDSTRPLARLRLVDAVGLPLGESAASAARARGAVALAADSLGGAQAVLRRTVAYVQDRTQFGRPVGSFQAVKHQLADMMVAIEQARSAVYWAACAIDEAASDQTIAVHAAKAFACDTYFACASASIQLHGGIGFTWEHDAHLYFKRAQANRTLLGTADQHREAIVSLVLPKAA